MRGMEYLIDRPGCEFPERVKIILRPTKEHHNGWTKPKARGRNNDRRSSMDKTGQFTRARQRLELVTLHGAVCHLCLCTIDMDLRWPDPECFTRDHVIPRAHGGPDTIDNLRPAHHACNLRRGDGPVTYESEAA
jgi:5-methylcytosine-specific restriction endonuclease McrA